jgi:hypothetical protein
VVEQTLETSLLETATSSAPCAAGQTLVLVNSLVLDERLKDHRFVKRV